MNVIKRNNVKVSGKGESVMMFAHGYGCSQNMWRLVAPAFADSHQIILFDHVGAGSSDISAYNKTKYGSLAGYAEDVVEICQALSLKDIIFVGHSVSAMIGALAAIRAPQHIAKLVMIGPNPCYMNDGDYVGGFDAATLNGILSAVENNYSEWAKAMAPVIMGNVNSPHLAVELAESFCSIRPEIAEDFARVTFMSDVRSDLAQLKTPSLILQCTEDAIAPQEVGHYLNKAIVNSELTLLKASGHCPHLSAPQETIEAIREYLVKG